MSLPRTPHPIPPHAGEGAAFWVGAVPDWIGRKVARTVAAKAPPLPRVGRGRGWGEWGI